jgi:hypothetical protein
MKRCSSAVKVFAPSRPSWSAVSNAARPENSIGCDDKQKKIKKTLIDAARLRAGREVRRTHASGPSRIVR